MPGPVPRAIRERSGAGANCADVGRSRKIEPRTSPSSVRPLRGLRLLHSAEIPALIDVELAKVHPLTNDLQFRQLLNGGKGVIELRTGVSDVDCISAQEPRILQRIEGAV